jgi:hypothetical protein
MTDQCGESPWNIGLKSMLHIEGWLLALLLSDILDGEVWDKLWKNARENTVGEG